MSKTYALRRALKRIANKRRAEAKDHVHYKKRSHFETIKARTVTIESYGRATSQKIGGAQQEQKEHSRNERALTKATERLRDFTAALVFVGILGVIASSLQWWEIHSGSSDTHDLAGAAVKQANIAQGQLDQMKLTLKQTDRSVEALEYQSRSFAITQQAFVEVATGPIVFNKEFVKGNSYFVYQPMWENDGNTQTVDLRVETHCPYFTVASEDFDNIVEKEKMIVGNRIIGPHKAVPGTECALTPENIADIMSKKYFGFIWLRARYNDVFGNHHITEWCGKIDIDQSATNVFDVNKVPGVAFNTIACARHNCAEQQCEGN